MPQMLKLTFVSFPLFSCPDESLRQLYIYPWSLTNYKGFYFLTLKSHPRDLWPLRHLISTLEKEVWSKIHSCLKGLFTNFFLPFKSHILDSNGVWYSWFWPEESINAPNSIFWVLILSPGTLTCGATWDLNSRRGRGRGPGPLRC